MSYMLVMVFAIILLVMVVCYIANAVYIQTVGYPLLVMGLFLVMILCKAILLPYYKSWYYLALALGLVIGAWFVNDMIVSTAKSGALFLAAVLIVDAVYTGYTYRVEESNKYPLSYKYATYGSVLSAVVLALTFGYTAL